MSSFRILLVGGGLLCAISAIYVRNLQDGSAAFPTLRHFQPRDIRIRDAEGALRRFAEGLRFKTVSRSNASNETEGWDAFSGLHAHLTQSYPMVFSKLQLKKVSQKTPHLPLTALCYTSHHLKAAPCSQVNEWSLLIKWPGRKSSLKPVLCISHQDVVPATSESAWTQHPFSGARAGGQVSTACSSCGHQSLPGCEQPLLPMLAVNAGA